MTFVLTNELLTLYAGVIPNIICCLYKVNPCTALRLLNKEIYTLTTPIWYDMYKYMFITSKEYKNKIAESNKCIYGAMVRSRPNNRTITHCIKMHKSFFHDDYYMITTTLELSKNKTNNNWTLHHFVSENPLRPFPHKISMMDVVSEHAIFSQRTNMIKIDPEYVMEKLCRRLKISHKTHKTHKKHLIILFHRLYYIMYNCLLLTILPKKYKKFNPITFTLSIDATDEDINKYTFQEFVSYLQPVDKDAYDIQKQQVIDEINFLQPILLDYIVRRFTV